MRRLSTTLLLAACVAGTSCATKTPLTDSDMCDRLDAWAKTIPVGQTRAVKLSRGGTWMVNHSKKYDRPNGDNAADTFCSWLVENTSTEFMEANINQAISCLQRQRISGYIGNTGVESWSGKATFSNPHLSAENVEIDLEYSVDYSSDGAEDFLQFTVRAE
jgi:hypothetical protein